MQYALSGALAQRKTASSRQWASQNSWLPYTQPATKCKAEKVWSAEPGAPKQTPDLDKRNIQALGHYAHTKNSLHRRI
jgi:hypothetical protein